MIARYSCSTVLSLIFCLPPALASPVRDCPGIVSNVERLACFDEAAKTPAYVIKRQWSAPEQGAASVLRVMANEAAREPDDLTFIASTDEGDLRMHGLVISAPAIASAEPRPYLAISCVEGISRLQFISARPLDARWVRVQLQGMRGATVARPWQVMENGQVLDAGRGLPAIEQIKKLIGAQRIRLLSDKPEVDGLMFDAQGLDPLISKARSTCRW
ncbi:type VI secretion system-associated protein VasI [Pseudomonas sp. SID14000]|uniref:type VI secretion system-associated protein VasI n=1 Tax=Pseudomonas sp. SID14000 TaxID=1986221 RepID=UPI000B3C33B4|nr:type VI secretion system-associated protein VasI [Pseudomonas sp. SID14000]